jgi:hypothetical protein
MSEYARRPEVTTDDRWQGFVDDAKADGNGSSVSFVVYGATARGRKVKQRITLKIWDAIDVAKAVTVALARQREHVARMERIARNEGY